MVSGLVLFSCIFVVCACILAYNFGNWLIRKIFRKCFRRTKKKCLLFFALRFFCLFAFAFAIGKVHRKTFPFSSALSIWPNDRISNANENRNEIKQKAKRSQSTLSIYYLLEVDIEERKENKNIIYSHYSDLIYRLYSWHLKEKDER